MAGLGRIFLRGKTWYFAFCHRGQETVRSSHSENRRDAERLLKEFVKALGRGYDPSEEKITFDNLVDKVKADRELNNIGGSDLEHRLVHLRPFFGRLRAHEITTEDVERYQRQRQGEGAANGTINREVAVLKRSLKLAHLSRPPVIKMLSEEGNARQGFLSIDQFEAVKAHLPEWARDIVSFMYFSSWRQGQVAALEWRDVDFSVDPPEIIARSETTKSGDSHRIPLAGALLDIIARARTARRIDCRHVFHHEGRPFNFRSGDAPIRVAWDHACKAAGLGEWILHDLRRSGIRNLMRAGADQNTAMRISGHKTDAVFRRYNIVSDDDVRKTLEQTAAFLAQPQDKKVENIR